MAYQGWGGPPSGSGGDGEGGNGQPCGCLGLLKLGRVGPGHGAVADAPHDGVSIAEGRDGVEKAVKAEAATAAVADAIGALSKAKCGSYLDHGSHGICGVIRVGYYDI